MYTLAPSLSPNKGPPPSPIRVNTCTTTCFLPLDILNCHTNQLSLYLLYNLPMGDTHNSKSAKQLILSNILKDFSDDLPPITTATATRYCQAYQEYINACNSCCIHLATILHHLNIINRARHWTLMFSEKPQMLTRLGMQFLPVDIVDIQICTHPVETPCVSSLGEETTGGGDNG